MFYGGSPPAELVTPPTPLSHGPTHKGWIQGSGSNGSSDRTFIFTENRTRRNSLGVFRRNINGPSLRFRLLLLKVYISDQVEQIGVCSVLCVLQSAVCAGVCAQSCTHTQTLEVRYSRTCVVDNHRPYVLHSAIMGCTSANGLYFSGERGPKVR